MPLAHVPSVTGSATRGCRPLPTGQPGNCHSRSLVRHKAQGRIARDGVRRASNARNDEAAAGHQIVLHTSSVAAGRPNMGLYQPFELYKSRGAHEIA